MLDPGDFTPAYDTALQAGLEAKGLPTCLIGKAGFNEMRDVGSRIDHFYRLSRRLPEGSVARLAKGMEHGFDLLRLGAVLDELRPRIIHAQWFPLPPLDRLFLSSLRRRAPLVITAHDSNPYNGDANPLMRAGYVSLLRLADRVVVHTEQGRERLSAAGVDDDRLVVLPHGLIHAAPEPSPEPPIASSIADRPRSQRLRLLQLGKIKHYKGVDILLDALALLSPDERAGLDVKIVGKPYMAMEPILERVARHGLADCVTIELGFVPEERLGELMRWADAALFPYREIDASGVVMAAIGQGLPVLASDIGGFSEMLRDGDGCALFPKEDPRALGRVLRRWLADPEEVVRLRGGMVERRAAVPSWEEIAGRTIEVYEAARREWRAPEATREAVLQ